MLSETDRTAVAEAKARAIIVAEAEALAASEALAAQNKAARIADKVKSGLALKLAERANQAAIEKANREAVDELGEVNAAIQAGLVESDRLAALQDKANKRKVAKAASAALVEAARVEALRLAAAGKITDVESGDEVVIIPFAPPPPSARELALLGKGSTKPLRVVTGRPTAEDVAALKAVVAQKELMKEFELLQRRDALLSVVAPAVTGGGLLFLRLFI